MILQRLLLGVFQEKMVRMRRMGLVAVVQDPTVLDVVALVALVGVEVVRVVGVVATDMQVLVASGAVGAVAR